MQPDRPGRRLACEPVASQAFAEELGRELDGWVRDGVVSAEQAAAIRRRYRDAGVAAGRGRAVGALATVGGLAIGVGVVLFFAANWDGIPRLARLVLLVAAVAGAYAAGFELREHRSRPALGTSLFLVGVLLYGASLFLVGQMYNVEAHDPLALLLWAGGAAATALVVHSRAIAAVAVSAFGGWLGFEYALASEDAGGGTWIAAPALAVFYGAVLHGVAAAAERQLRASGFATVMRALGPPLVAAGVYVFTFAEAADELGSGARDLGGWALAGLVVLAAATLLAAAALAATGRATAPAEGAALAVAVLLFPLALGLGDLHEVVYAVLFNLVFAALALGALYVGYRNEEPWLVNAGVVMVAADLLGRYFDVFWAALPRSLGLIGGGALVLVLAYVLDRRRRDLLERMRA